MLATINHKPKFRGKFKNKSFCQWIGLYRKTYIIEGGDDNNDDDSDDSDDSDDWDKGEFINGNKQVVHIRHRRPGIFQLFTPLHI